MKKVFVILPVSLCFGVILVVLWANPAHAKDFPGDGTDVDSTGNDAFGTPDHGPPLSYRDNGDGTFTDNDTKFVWEIKTDDDSIHDVDNTYKWSDSGTAADGTLFTVFLDTLNNSCRDDETVACESNSDCAVPNGGPGGPCGFPGKRDWCIPNVKRLQSIVDYGTFGPASSVPGETAASFYWSSTTVANGTNVAWIVNFFDGGVNFSGKGFDLFARAVRPCS
jgi:hypothetical protein